MTTTTAPSTLIGFDDSRINWRRLGDFEHFLYTVLDIDAEREIVDFAIKFAANERIFLHRHCAQTNTFVVHGEHRLYEPDGSLKEIRPTGTYTATPVSPEPHREGGGAEDAIVFYSTRGSTGGVVFEVLDDQQNVVATLTLDDLGALFDAQDRKPGR